VDAFREYLTGFSKRKQAKLAEKKEKAIERDRLAQQAEKREVRRPASCSLNRVRWPLTVEVVIGISWGIVVPSSEESAGSTELRGRREGLRTGTFDL
jgi:hypothetical protein